MVGSAERKVGDSTNADASARAQGTPAGRVSVVCIGAVGQSGSTLLARMLGQVPDHVAVGETGRVWDKGLIEDMECGCGVPFRSCPFWARVGHEAFGGWQHVDAREATRLRDQLTLTGRAPHPFALPLILRPSLSRSFSRDLVRYQELMQRLYEGIYRASEGRTIVDSMKQPAHVYMVSRMPAIDLAVVHLVRDSRGVAYSKTKYVHRQGARKDEYRVRRNPPKASEKWMWINAAFDVLPRLGVTMSRVRYEDVVRDPKPTLERVLRQTGKPAAADDLSFVDESRVKLGGDHFAAGSRMRMDAGVIALRLDEEWREKLPPKNRRVVTAISWPLLRRYGYEGGDSGS
jgi:hypothetical protein